MKIIRIALVGQPNVGKTLLINSISGSKLKVGNFAGVTVEKKEVSFDFGEYRFIITDLPGTYSLNDYTIEERVTKTYLLNDAFDMILNVIDSTNLERNLYLTTELLELDAKMVIALNMSDEAEKENITIDVDQLSRILGSPCVSVSAATKTGIEKLIKQIIRVFNAPKAGLKVTYSEVIEKELITIQQFIADKGKQLIPEGMNVSPRRAAVLLIQEEPEFYKVIHENPVWLELSEVVKKSLNNIYDFHHTKDLLEIFHEQRHAFSKGAVVETATIGTQIGISLTERIDSFLIHKIFGLPIFLGLMWALFQATFELGSIPMEWIDAAFIWLGDIVGSQIANDSVRSLIVDGAISGIGAVIMFLPNIVILFIGVALLENTGYMARVAFLLDGLFHKFGLHGKSFIPLISGFGCSVPAYMSARILKSQKDRIITMFIIGFMSCGAKLPVYVLFCGAFFSQEQAGNVLFIIYLGGALLGLLAAKFLKVFIFKGQDEPFVMEMPKYRFPSARLMWNMVFNKGYMYIKKAGTFILAASIIIWFASNYPKQPEIEESYTLKAAQISATAEKQLADTVLHFNARAEGTTNAAEKLLATNRQLEATEAIASARDSLLQVTSNEKSKELLENSILGYIGKATQPFFAPLGFDWRMTIALETGLLAKEVIVATMGVLYSLGDEVDEQSESLMMKLQSAIPFNSAIAFIIFVMLYLPCLAAVAVFKKEAGGYKYVAYLFIFTTAAAWIFSFIGYHVASFFM